MAAGAGQSQPFRQMFAGFLQMRLRFRRLSVRLGQPRLLKRDAAEVQQGQGMGA